jgi:hypothetical protein
MFGLKEHFYTSSNIYRNTNWIRVLTPGDPLRSHNFPGMWTRPGYTNYISATSLVLLLVVADGFQNPSC